MIEYYEFIFIELISVMCEIVHFIENDVKVTQNEIESIFFSLMQTGTTFDQIIN